MDLQAKKAYPRLEGRRSRCGAMEPKGGTPESGLADKSRSRRRRKKIIRIN